MANPGFTKTYNAGADIGAYKIVAASTPDGTVILATAGTDPIIGVSQNVDVISGQQVDVIHDDSANVKLGGTVVFGDPITSDGTGQGVKANPSTGVNSRYIGFALLGGVSGDIVPVLIKPGYLQG
jgi:hypothetical protein